MSRWNSYLNTGKRIIEDYGGGSPLSAWLKDFFRQHKQMGSRDRKIISELVYGFYRLGRSLPHVSVEKKLLAARFILAKSSDDILDYFKPEWNTNTQLSADEKEAYLNGEGLNWQRANIFPWQDALSSGIEEDLFNFSHLQQPDLFLRIRPLQETIVDNKLNEAGILYEKLGDNCILVANASKIDRVLKIDEEVVIQDYNSQRTGDYSYLKSGGAISVWDCCAGSGGKSIMAYDHNPAINLSVSDSRVSIIQKLTLRFQKAGIKNYRSFVKDLTVSQSPQSNGLFDYIIADVPCSGSGTWGRTPEQLYFFDDNRINYYSDLQKRIVSTVIPAIKEGGRLQYITCSVFKKENEEVVEFLKANFGLQLETMELLKGYQMKADSLFVAVLKKPY